MRLRQLLCFGLLAVASVGHADSTPTSNKGDVIFDASVGAGIEDRTGDNEKGTPGRVLVEIETRIRNEKTKVDYAWVTATAGFGATSDGNGAQLSSLDLHIVPALIHEGMLSNDCTDDTGAKVPCLYSIGVRIAPTDIHREVSFGLNGSVVIHAIGLQGTLHNAADTHLLQIYVDTLGLSYMSMANSPDLIGMDLFHIGVRSELTWHPGKSSKVALNYYPLLAEVTVGFGKSGGDLYDAIPVTGQAFTRLEAAIKTAYGQYAAYVEGGGEELVIDRTEAGQSSDVFGALVARLGFDVRF